MIFLCYTIDRAFTFQSLVNLMILGSSVFIGYETEVGQSDLVKWFNRAALAVFACEVVIKLGAAGIRPGSRVQDMIQRYFNDHWNKFDFTIVLAGILEEANVKIGPVILLRMLRK